MKLVNKMYYLVLALVVVFTLNNCSTDQIAPQEEEGISIKKDVVEQSQRNNGNGVIHHVSAGGNDACEAFGLEPGCDGNFSLTVNMRADGTVTGQWQDTFAGGGFGIHATIDCMFVDGNMAIVSGYVTHGSFDGETDATGQYIITKVVDNGTSNNDTPDQISFSYSVTDEFSCELYANSNFALFDLTRGQVKVK
jgi:hypothetical protein